MRHVEADQLIDKVVAVCDVPRDAAAPIVCHQSTIDGFPNIDFK
jgi:hypothetical protein